MSFAASPTNAFVPAQIPFWTLRARPKRCRHSPSVLIKKGKPGCAKLGLYEEQTFEVDHVRRIPETTRPDNR